MTNNDVLKCRWEESYLNGDNRTYWPLEEMIRFLARHVVKRIDFDRLIWRNGFQRGSTLLDFGCGAGRHLKFGLELGFDVFGIDLSENAISYARKWLEREHPNEFKAEQLSYGEHAFENLGDRKFEVIISASCLDSMPFSDAKRFVKRFREKIKSHGVFLFDVISGDETGRPTGFAGEVIVEDSIENGTIQSYFNREKIDELLSGNFKIIERVLLRAEDDVRAHYSGRYFIACSPI